MRPVRCISSVQQMQCDHTFRSANRAMKPFASNESQGLQRPLAKSTRLDADYGALRRNKALSQCQILRRATFREQLQKREAVPALPMGSPPNPPAPVSQRATIPAPKHVQHNESARFSGELIRSIIKFAVCSLAFLLVGFLGVCICILSSGPTDQRLLQEGERQLRNKQFAFAVETLERAAKANPHSARVAESLTEAYLEIDQTDKASRYIKRCEKNQVKLGNAIKVKMARRYRNQKHFEKSLAILEPLAKADRHLEPVVADTYAAWADELEHDGKLKQSAELWRSVRQLHCGFRYPEANIRIAVLTQKMESLTNTIENAPDR